jgi:nitrate reductase cytochrome c-type subunit
MYAGLVGIYADQPFKYARVPLTHEFEDATEMRLLMKEYQDQLRDIGLGGLGLLPPIPHSSRQKFIGSEKCGKCHTTAYDIWQGTPHVDATAHIVEPPEERGDVARHFDPECISCHVTGWNPQEYYPYESGYLSLDESKHLTGSGCENCHGPGSEHAAAEAEDSRVAAELRDQLRDSMKLPLDRARDKCMKCHDLDNSPDFHEEDAFEDIYWPEVEHYGLD